jgi:hypothetical protein
MRHRKKLWRQITRPNNSTSLPCETCSVRTSKPLSAPSANHPGNNCSNLLPATSWSSPPTNLLLTCTQVTSITSHATYNTLKIRDPEQHQNKTKLTNTSNFLLLETVDGVFRSLRGHSSWSIKLLKTPFYTGKTKKKRFRLLRTGIIIAFFFFVGQINCLFLFLLHLRLVVAVQRGGQVKSVPVPAATAAA